MDFRFLLKKYTRREEFGYLGGEVFNIPVSSVIPEPYNGTYLYGRSMLIPTAREEGIDPDRYLRVLKVKCKADYPMHIFHDGKNAASLPTWFADLEDHYGDKRLKENRICPHRGADLSTFTPDADGCITCPLHGLKWHVESGRLVRRGQNAPTETLEVYR